MKIVKGIFITSFITLFIFLTIDHFFGRIILDYLNNKSDGISSFSSKDKNLGLTFEKSQKIRNAQWGNYYYTFCSNEFR